MPSAVLTPTVAQTASNVGGRMRRKQVLPIGSINYTDPATGATRRLDFTRDYLSKIVDSFDKRAYDAVKFQLADAKNTHTSDPERARGTIRAFELTDSGLDMIVDLTDDGVKVIDENPDLPVSARIVEDLARADGQAFPVAIQHVLGTLDPRVPGMTPWQAVDLSAENVPTVDLTAEDYTTPKKEGLMADLTAKLRKVLGLGDSATEDEIVAAAEKKAQETTAEPQLSAEELAALEALANEPVTASLSADDQRKIDLAQADAATARREAAELRANARRSAWAADSVTLLHSGVPKALLDLAAPWCGGDTPAGFIDLAASETTVESVRAAAEADMRKFVDACKGFIDLSVIGETPEPEAVEQEKTLLEAWDKQYPVKR